MDNIYEILNKIGISVPADKKDEFDKLLLENYRTVNEVKNWKKQKESVILIRISMTRILSREMQILKTCKQS